MAAESSDAEPVDDLVETWSNPEMVPEVLQKLPKSRKPGKLKDYQSGRTFCDLMKVAEENLGTACGPGADLELCGAEIQANVEPYAEVSASAGKLGGNIRDTVKGVKVVPP